jgi:hypothetical protein
MEQMYREHRDIAEFFLVYISEAHAKNDIVPTYSAFKYDIREPESAVERAEVADKLVRNKGLTMPCLVDQMGNEVAKSYHAWPDRVYLIDENGRIGVRSPRGPAGIKRALKRVNRWLDAHRETLDGVR